MVHPPSSKEELIDKLRGMSWDQIKQFSIENPGLLVLEEETETHPISVLQRVMSWFSSNRVATRAKG